MRTPLLLYAVALAVRVALAAHFPDPAYPDSFYYADVARSLAAGHGFSVDVIWIFAEVGGRLPADPVLPIASNAHWMPLASIVQLPFLALFGSSASVAALPFALSGALAAPLAWAIGREAGARPIVSVGAAVLAAVPGALAPFLAQPDNFGLYEPLVAGALWLAARGLKGDARAFALSGLLVGLATLSRNDGVLVGGVIGLAFLWNRWRAWRAGRGRASTQPTGTEPGAEPTGTEPGAEPTGTEPTGRGRARAIPVWSAAACAGLFVVVMGPWIARQLAVFGTISPSTASGKVTFIRNIGEWNSITTPATLDWLLGQGAGPLLASRVEGLVAAIVIFSVLVGSVLLVPFMVVGAWGRRRSIDFGPFFGYALVLFAFSAIVSAVHVPGGTFIHSAVALAPHAFVLALEGVAAAVAWLAARRPRWNVEQAIGVFVGATLVFAAGVAAWSSLTVHATWAVARDRLQAEGAAIAAAGGAPSDRVMSIDASGTKYWTGHPGVVLVNDPLATIETVARAYDVRWLVLDRSNSVDAVTPILDEASRPAWLGAPAWVLREGATAPGSTTPGSTTPGSTTPGSTASQAPVEAAVYPVCLSAGDDRCAPSASAPADSVP